MLDLISRKLTNFAARLGHCSRCMQQSLMAALTGWGVYAACALIWPGAGAPRVLAVAALALSALWVLHVAAYALRGLARARSRGDAKPAPGYIERPGRRRAIGGMLRAAGLGVAASVPVLLLPTGAQAFCGQCTHDADCGPGFECKNTDPVNAGTVCNECVKSAY